MIIIVESRLVLVTLQTYKKQIVTSVGCHGFTVFGKAVLLSDVTEP